MQLLSRFIGPRISPTHRDAVAALMQHTLCNFIRTHSVLSLSTIALRVHVQVPLIPGGTLLTLTHSNRLQYVDAAISYRLHEFDAQIDAVGDFWNRE